MSTQTAISPASSFDLAADRSHYGRRERKPGEIAVGVIIGRTSEFFDFFVYAIASVVVFPNLMFPYVDALMGTLLSFAIFALALVARPLGTVVFTDPHGRHTMRGITAGAIALSPQGESAH